MPDRIVKNPHKVGIIYRKKLYSRELPRSLIVDPAYFARPNISAIARYFRGALSTYPKSVHVAVSMVKMQTQQVLIAVSAPKHLNKKFDTIRSTCAATVQALETLRQLEREDTYEIEWSASQKGTAATTAWVRK